MPAGTCTGHTYLQRPRLNGRHCLGENATLKLPIKEEQSPEGERVMNTPSERVMKEGRKGRLSEKESHLVLRECRGTGGNSEGKRMGSKKERARTGSKGKRLENEAGGGVR